MLYDTVVLPATIKYASLNQDDANQWKLTHIIQLVEDKFLLNINSTIYKISAFDHNVSEKYNLVTLIINNRGKSLPCYDQQEEEYITCQYCDLCSRRKHYLIGSFFVCDICLIVYTDSHLYKCLSNQKLFGIKFTMIVSCKYSLS